MNNTREGSSDPLPVDWEGFWAHVQSALACAGNPRRPRARMRRFIRELKRRVGPDPCYRDPRAVVNMIDRIWAERPEVRQAGRLQ